MSDRPPPRYASSPPRPSGPPIPRDEPQEEEMLRKAVRKTPAVEITPPPPPSDARIGNAAEPRKHDSGTKALADTPLPRPAVGAGAAPAGRSPSKAPRPAPRPDAKRAASTSAPPPPAEPLPSVPPVPSPLPPPAIPRAPALPTGTSSDAAPSESRASSPAEAVARGTSSAPPPRRARKPWNDNDWQKLWLSMQARPWRSLAIVAGSPGMSTSPLEVATALADVGWQHLGKPIGVVDARETTLGHVETRQADIAARLAKGERVMIVLSSVFDNPATLAIARSADACVVCVVLGQSKVKPAEQTVDEIGRDRFLGSVVLRDPPKP